MYISVHLRRPAPHAAAWQCCGPAIYPPIGSGSALIDGGRSVRVRMSLRRPRGAL